MEVYVFFIFGCTSDSTGPVAVLSAINKMVWYPCSLSQVLIFLSLWLCLCQKGTVDLEREEGEECEENMEVFDDSSSSPSGTLRNYPLTCKVLYSYKVTSTHLSYTVVVHTHAYRCWS